MSAQTIIHPSISSMKRQSEETFIKNADKYLLERMYGLGDGYCAFEQFDSTIIYDIIQSNDCKLLSLVQKQLEEFEESSNLSNMNKQDTYSKSFTENRHDNLYELWRSQGNRGSRSDFLKLAVTDDKADWDEIKW